MKELLWLNIVPDSIKIHTVSRSHYILWVQISNMTVTIIIYDISTTFHTYCRFCSTQKTACNEENRVM